MPRATYSLAQPVRAREARPDARGGGEHAQRGGLADHHPAYLPRRRGERAEQGDVAVALLDRQAHGAGDDEHADEQRASAEDAGDGDDELASVVDVG